MFNVLKKVIAPQSEGAFLSSTEIDAAFSRFRQASASLEAARVLTDKADSLIEASIQSIENRFSPVSLSPDSRHTTERSDNDVLVREIGRYLQIIVYCLVAGGTEPIDQYVATKIDEANPSLELSPNPYIEALTYIKDHHGLKGDAATEANFYLDYAIHAIS